MPSLQLLLRQLQQPPSLRPHCHPPSTFSIFLPSYQMAVYWVVVSIHPCFVQLLSAAITTHRHCFLGLKYLLGIKLRKYTIRPSAPCACGSRKDEETTTVASLCPKRKEIYCDRRRRSRRTVFQLSNKRQTHAWKHKQAIRQRPVQFFARLSSPYISFTAYVM